MRSRARAFAGLGILSARKDAPFWELKLSRRCRPIGLPRRPSTFAGAGLRWPRTIATAERPRFVGYVPFGPRIAMRSSDGEQETVTCSFPTGPTRCESSTACAVGLSRQADAAATKKIRQTTQPSARCVDLVGREGAFIVSNAAISANQRPPPCLMTSTSSGGRWACCGARLPPFGR